MTNNKLNLFLFFILTHSLSAFAAPTKIYSVGSSQMTFFKSKEAPVSLKVFSSVVADEAKGVVDVTVSHQENPKVPAIVVNQYKYVLDPSKKSWSTDMKIGNKIERYPAQLTFDKGLLKEISVITKILSPASKEPYSQRTVTQITANEMNSSIDVYDNKKAPVMQIKYNGPLVPENQYLGALKGLKARPGM